MTDDPATIDPHGHTAVTDDGARRVPPAERTGFPARLRALRKRRSMSQAALAERAGVHFTQVSRYERAETHPSAASLAALARALDTTADYLTDGAPDDLARAAGLDRDLVARLRDVQDLPPDDKRTVLTLLDAFVARQRIQELLLRP